MFERSIGKQGAEDHCGSEVKRSGHLLALTKNEEGEHDAIDGFHVHRQHKGVGRNFAHEADAGDEGIGRTYDGQDAEVTEITRAQSIASAGIAGTEQHQDTQPKHAASHLVHRYYRGIVALGVLSVDYSKESGQGCGDDGRDHSSDVVGLKAKNQVEADDGYYAEQHLIPNDFSLVEEGFKDGSEEGAGRKTGEGHRYVGNLDGMVEGYPVRGDDQTGGEQQQLFLARELNADFGVAGESIHPQQGEDHAVPHQLQRLEGDEFAEDGREAPDEDDEMQLDERRLVILAQHGRGIRRVVRR